MKIGDFDDEYVRLEAGGSWVHRLVEIIHSNKLLDTE